MDKITIYRKKDHFIVGHGTILARVDGTDLEEVFKYIRRMYEQV